MAPHSAAPLAHAHKLCSHDELPAWAHDNAFIRTGYRRPGGTAAVHAGQSSDTATASAVDGDAGETRIRTRSAARAAAAKTQPEKPPAELYEHDSVAKCVQSIYSYWHNETVNIHTHLWGAAVAFSALLLSLLCAAELLPASVLIHPILSAHAPRTGSLLASSVRLSPVPADNTWIDGLAFATFGIAAVICLGCSATFHTLHAHSEQVSQQCNSLDYIGIVVMIWGSFIPALHYGFICHPHLQAAYAAFITVLSVMAMYTVVTPKYRTPAYRPTRTAVFVSLGLSAVVPVGHGLHLYGFDLLARTMGLHWLIASGAFYIVGALLYACRVPERFAPGRFDYLGASHQIFHVFILLAALAHFVCLRRAHDFWKSATLPGLERSSQQAVCYALDHFADKVFERL